jgi:predicted nucleic acid-binding protein
LIVSDLLLLSGIVRDPNDDMVLACAIAAEASHVVTRDDDLLSLGGYESVAIVSPETFLAMWRSSE